MSSLLTRYLLVPAALLALAGAGCGGDTPAPPDTPAPGLAAEPLAPAGPAGVPEAAPESVEHPAKEAAPPNEGATSESTAETHPGLDPLHRKLVGTQWRINDIEVEFLGPEKVFVQGGVLTEFYPDGTEARYTYADGAVVVSVMGQSTEAQWDGEQLRVGGMPAVALETGDTPQQGSQDAQ